MATKKPLSAKEGIQLEEKSGAVTYNEQNEGLIYNENDTKLHAQIGGADREIVTDDQSQTLTNKVINADNNTVSNVGDEELKAGIDAAKLADGSVSNTELQYINSVTSNVQDQIDAKTDDTTVDAHIADASGAHAGSAISNIPAGNLAATDVQGALNELQGDIDTNATSISDHIADATAAHAGSAISNTPSGNLAATDVQGALNELQTEVDGLATSTELSNHIADTTTHGTTGDIVGTSDAQVLTNKTIDADLNTISNIGNEEIKAGVDAVKLADGSVTNAELQYINSLDSNAQDQIDGKADTTGTAENTFAIGDNLDTNKTLEFDNGDANNPAIRFNASGNALEFANDGVTFQEFGSGSGGGGLDTFYTEDFETTLIGSIDSGNNATFLGGGSIAGTLVYETTNPIAGTQSLKLTQAAGSLNDYVALPAITLDDKEKGNSIGFNHYFTYDGDAGDIEVIVWDVTNAVQLVANVSGEQTKYYTNKGNPTRFTVQVYPPTTATTLRVGFQVKVANSGAILVVDDFEGSSNPFVGKSLLEPLAVSQIRLHTGNGRGSTNIAIRRFATVVENIGTDITYTDSTTDGATFTVNSDGWYEISYADVSASAASTYGISLNSTQLTTGIQSITTSDVLKMQTVAASLGASVEICVYLETGDIIRAHNAGLGDANTTVSFTMSKVDTRTESPAIIHSSTGTENDFTAVIPSSGTSVTSEGANAISSLSWSVNTATVNLNAGQFANQPAVSIFPEPTSYTVSNTTITATFASPIEFNLFISSQGTDYKNPNAYAVTQQTTETVQIVDGSTAPATASFAQMYIDTADGDLKIKFADGTVKTITTDT